MIGTRPEVADETMRECVEFGIKHVWMHRGPGAGSVSQTAAAFGRGHGAKVIAGGCPACSARPQISATGRCVSLMYEVAGIAKAA